MVDDDLNQVEEDTEALRSAGGSPRASAGPGSAAGSPRVGNAERTL